MQVERKVVDKEYSPRLGTMTIYFYLYNDHLPPPLDSIQHSVSPMEDQKNSRTTQTWEWNGRQSSRFRESCKRSASASPFLILIPPSLSLSPYYGRRRDTRLVREWLS